MRNLLVFAAAVSLAACGGKPAAEEAKNDTAAPAENAAAAAEPATTETAAATPAAGAAPTKEFMVGKWGQDGDCQMAIDFKADGSMVGPVDKWELDGNGVLTMVGLPQKMHLTVVDDKTMESRLDGKNPPDRLTRC